MLLTGSFPFDIGDQENIESNWITAIKERFDEDGNFLFLEAAGNISKEAKAIISWMLKIDQDERLSAEELLQDEWFTGVLKVEVNIFEAMTVFNNMKNNATSSETTLKKILTSYIGSQLLLKDEREKYSGIFNFLDINGDGILTKEEIKVGYRAVNKKPILKPVLEQMFKIFDKDNSGHIEYSEFIIAAMSS